MPAWFVRISGGLAYTAAALLSLWVSGLPAGVALPASGLVALAWAVVVLVWLRVVALWLWWSDDNYFWMPAHRSRTERSDARPLSLEKGAGSVRRQRPSVLRRLAAYEYASVPWVYMRQAAVWLLVLLSFMALSVLGHSHTSQHIRSLVRAGAAYSTATVTEVVDVTEIRDDEDRVTGYHATLLLALPDGSRVRSQGAYTEDEPKPNSRVEVLWAPTATALGGVVAEGEPLERHLDREWGLTLYGMVITAFALLLVLACMLPISVGAEADNLQDLAWSPVEQTVHAAAVTGILLAALPYLSGTFSDGSVQLGAACFGLLALYIAMPIRALFI
ncbi:hypothetical protein J7E93_11720 [Streptomyces sp. ISL-36]|uniref:hypothetical protein n=1 Tax=Streptomyces sp. ISL-36 TaxID=2819182 RepID=UPI001BEB8D05|nr:hypothetical protein [Streptomyces sp. ISL-36]MBT2440763.1 hypothetical protein [Streptomyces sp. ISL-36]